MSKKKEFIQNSFICTSFILLAFALQFSTNSMLAYDSYYHIKIAKLYKSQLILFEFPWLYYTHLNQSFVDHHYLYHLILVPFTLGNDLLLGGKIAAVFLCSLLLLVYWICLKRLQIQNAFLFCILLYCSSWPFLYRINMLRAQTWANILLLIWIIAAIEKRQTLLLLTSFVFVWSYQSFVILPPLIVILFAIQWKEQKKISWRVCLYAFAGVILGIGINPYFPQNVIFYYTHLTDIAKKSVSQEWLPYNTRNALFFSWPTFICYTLAVLIAFWDEKRRSYTSKLLFVISLFFLFLYAYASRFIEYWPTIAILFCAQIWQECISVLDKKQFKTCYIFLCLIIVFGALFTHHKYIAVLQAERPPYQLQGASDYIKSHTKKNTVIYHTNWSQFPQLFFHNHNNYYLLGLNPTFMEAANRNLYYQMQRINDGQIKNIGSQVHKLFHTRYIIATTRDKAFLKKAFADSSLICVYQDSYSYVFYKK